jgi:hypothetical protein
MLIYYVYPDVLILVSFLAEFQIHLLSFSCISFFQKIKNIYFSQSHNQTCNIFFFILLNHNSHSFLYYNLLIF